MKTRLLFLLLLAVNFISAQDNLSKLEFTELRFAQLYTKQIIDKETLKPLAYVNVGTVNNFNGAVSDENGFFRLGIIDEYNTDTLRFSYIGYETLNIPVAVFKVMIDEKIALKRKENLIESLEKPTRFKEKIIRNKRPLLEAVITLGNGNGEENGILLPIKKRSFLKEFSMPVIYRNNDTDSLIFRLNFYRQTSKTDFVTILNEPIYVCRKLNNGRQNITVDLTPYNIVVAENTLVTVESIKQQKEGYFYMVGKFFFGKKTFRRGISQYDLHKMPTINMCMGVTADVER